MNNSLTKTKSNQVAFGTFVSSDSVRNKIGQAIGKNNIERFTASIVSAVSTNPDLQKCEPSTIISCALVGESLKLPPSPQLGYVYIVPFYSSREGTSKATFQLGYKGYLQLAMRTGQYKKIVVSEVKKGELIGSNPITEEYDLKPIMDAKERAKADTVGYYGFFELVNGFKKELYWTKEEMEEHALEYSTGYKSDKTKKTAYTFWSKDFDGMAKKTIIRQLLGKYGIMSSEMQTAYQSDMASPDLDGNIEYVDNLKEDKYSTPVVSTGEPVEVPFSDAEETPIDVALYNDIDNA